MKDKRLKIENLYETQQGNEERKLQKEGTRNEKCESVLKFGKSWSRRSL